MVKLFTSRSGVEVIDDAESTPGQSRQLSIVRSRINDLLFNPDTDETFNEVFGPEFIVSRTERVEGGTIRYLEFVSEIYK